MSDSAAVQLVTRRGRRPAFLDPHIKDRILESIRAGGWDYQAAKAAGIHKDTFQDWMTRGRAARERGDEEDVYYLFRLSVEQAKAEARVRAEQAVYQKRPDLWLLKGPGRERRGEPGWGDELPSNQPTEPMVLTFDIVKASGGILPPALRDGGDGTDDNRG